MEPWRAARNHKRLACGRTDGPQETHARGRLWLRVDREPAAHYSSAVLHSGQVDLP
jgi:hypothetical protein